MSRKVTLNILLGDCNTNMPKLAMYGQWDAPVVIQHTAKAFGVRRDCAVVLKK